MGARLLPNGNLLVPTRAESPDAIGDSLEEIPPSHPDYVRWLRFLDPPNTPLPASARR